MEQFELKESTSDNVPLVWKEIKAHSMRTFQLGDEPEVIHIIKTGFEDKYIVTWEDAYELMIGNTQILTKEEIKHNNDI
jgi:hypothetical protein